MATTTFTRAEVAKHTGLGGTAPYIILHNLVYDVTAWLHEHPGGNAILMENAGTDATCAFEDQGHSKVAIETRKQFFIGGLVPEEWTLWTRVFKPQDSNVVEKIEFSYNIQEQKKDPLSSRWEKLKKEHDIGPGRLTITDMAGVEVPNAEGLAEERFPLRAKFVASGAEGGSMLGKVVVAALAAVYIKKTLDSPPMPSVTYGKALRHVHLLMAAGITGSLWTVNAAGAAHDKGKKLEWIELHKKSGVLMLLAIGVRIWLRMKSAIPPRFPGPLALQRAETASHKAFYAFATLLPLTGLAYSYIGGTDAPIFGSKADPTMDDVQTAQTALDLHRLLGRIFELVWLPFHLGTMAYHYGNDRGVVRRITPFL